MPDPDLVPRYRLLVYRSLGVPDILLEESKHKAATHKLTQQAPPHHVDRVSGTRVPVTDTRQAEHSAAIIEAIVDYAASGKLDSYLGKYGDTETSVAAVATSAGKAVINDASAKKSATYLLQLLTSYVDKHPFVDENGRPFE